jgi:WD40 repeat protein
MTHKQLERDNEWMDGWISQRITVPEHILNRCLFTGHKSTIMCCQFSPDNNNLSSSSMDRSTRLWDIRVLKTKLTLRGHTNAVTSCCFSPDGRWLSTGSWDKQILVWDIATGTFRFIPTGRLIIRVWARPQLIE